MRCKLAEQFSQHQMLWSRCCNAYAINDSAPQLQPLQSSHIHAAVEYLALAGANYLKHDVLASSSASCVSKGSVCRVGVQVCNAKLTGQLRLNALDIQAATQSLLISGHKQRLTINLQATLPSASASAATVATAQQQAVK